jgi:hypothetical protein
MIAPNAYVDEYAQNLKGRIKLMLEGWSNAFKMPAIAL